MFTAMLSVFYFGVQSVCLFGHILIRLAQFSVEEWRDYRRSVSTCNSPNSNNII